MLTCLQRKRRVETKREEEEDSSSTPATPNANSTPSETPPSTPSGAGADRKIKKEFSDLVGIFSLSPDCL